MATSWQMTDCKVCPCACVKSISSTCDIMDVLFHVFPQQTRTTTWLYMLRGSMKPSSGVMNEEGGKHFWEWKSPDVAFIPKRERKDKRISWTEVSFHPVPRWPPACPHVQTSSFILIKTRTRCAAWVHHSLDMWTCTILLHPLSSLISVTTLFPPWESMRLSWEWGSTALQEDFSIETSCRKA